MLLVTRALFVLLAAVCCLSGPAAAAPLVLFDEAHGQHFRIGGNGPLDLSELAELFRSSGFAVASHAGGLTREALAAVDVLILSGPFMPLTEDELAAVTGFVEAGGGLAVMLHIAPPVRDLLHRLEVDFTNGTLRETSQLISDNPLDFRVVNLADHPLTSGLESFSVYGAWALRGTALNTMIVAETSQHGWVDLDHDNQLSQRDAVQQFGVMVAGEMGRGRYVVIGDDALFQNRFFDAANRRLALRLAAWLGSR